MPTDEELRTSLAHMAEAAELDFKSKVEVADAGDWLEIIKDIAAFACVRHSGDEKNGT
jgi:hypothetical protein